MEPQDVLEQSHLPQTFVVSESHCQELVQSTPLIKDGESIKVTESNKEFRICRLCFCFGEVA